jgi:hypothetical protein
MSDVSRSGKIAGSRVGVAIDCRLHGGVAAPSGQQQADHDFRRDRYIGNDVTARDRGEWRSAADWIDVPPTRAPRGQLDFGEADAVWQEMARTLRSEIEPAVD